MKRMMLLVGMTIFLGFAASTVSMAQMGSAGFNPNANKPPDQKRGLDRADQVNAGKVGQPGQQGRDNARLHHKPGSPGGSPGGTPPTTDPCLGC
jgi:hypothetical protein